MVVLVSDSTLGGGGGSVTVGACAGGFAAVREADGRGGSGLGEADATLVSLAALGLRAVRVVHGT